MICVHVLIESFPYRSLILAVGNDRSRVVDLALELLLVFELGFVVSLSPSTKHRETYLRELRRDQPQDDGLVLRQELERLKRPSSRCVVLQIVRINIDLGE